LVLRESVVIKIAKPKIVIGEPVKIIKKIKKSDKK
jgi:ribosomal protein S3